MSLERTTLVNFQNVKVIFLGNLFSHLQLNYGMNNMVLFETL